MSIEHRAAASTEQVTLDVNGDHGAAFSIVDAVSEAPEPPSPEQRILQVLEAECRPLAQRQLREIAKLRAQTVSATLARLVEQERVVHSKDGYGLKRT